MTITPEKIIWYLKVKIYSDEDANLDKDPPLHHRQNSVLFWEKAEITKMGNLTRSAVLDKLLHVMNKIKVAHRGKPFIASRSFIPKKFKCLVRLCETHNNLEVGPWLASYMTFQLHMIVRLEDTTKFWLPDLKSCFKYPNSGVTTRLCWTKDSIEEQDAPTEVLSGAHNWR